MELDALVDMIEKPTWKTLLVNTVKVEGMDPWSIDVTSLASKYSQRIKQMKVKDFRIPANTVLASAILVRFKSDSWELLPCAPQEEEDPWQEYERLGLLDGTQELPELDMPQRLTKRKVTLEELIGAIETVMDKTKKKARKVKFSDAIEHIRIGEKEEFEKTMEDVYNRVLANADSQNMALFSQLLKEKTRPEVAKVLLSVLHLAFEERVAIWQEKHFDEIFVYVAENGGSKNKKARKHGKKKQKTG
jgi:chromatin segregation and condensation protein Rec8/ScpA/Scc1 (kleisin family)